MRVLPVNPCTRTLCAALLLRQPKMSSGSSGISIGSLAGVGALVAGGFVVVRRDMMRRSEGLPRRSLALVLSDLLKTLPGQMQHPVVKWISNQLSSHQTISVLALSTLLWLGFKYQHYTRLSLVRALPAPPSCLLFFTACRALNPPPHQLHNKRPWASACSTCRNG